jgi:hypothetical protein
MKVHLGIKSDPIEGRYTFDWLFGLMNDLGVDRLQYGSAVPALLADDGYFQGLRREAEKRGILIASLLTANREFGGFASGNPFLQAATLRLWERIIRVASLLGAKSAGTNASIAPRDRPDWKEPGILTFFVNVKRLMFRARAEGLEALTTEPMSSTWEFPATPEDIGRLAADLDPFHAANPDTTVPFLLCGDISHGVADESRRVVHDNWALFEKEIPWMWEFHIKNTDPIFHATFGFGGEEVKKGIIDPARLARTIEDNASRFPVPEITGYLEIPGPKVGRDYTDGHLGRMLSESITELQGHFRTGS